MPKSPGSARWNEFVSALDFSSPWTPPNPRALHCVASVSLLQTTGSSRTETMAVVISMSPALGTGPGTEDPGMPVGCIIGSRGKARVHLNREDELILAWFLQELCDIAGKPQCWRCLSQSLYASAVTLQGCALRRVT